MEIKKAFQKIKGEIKETGELVLFGPKVEGEIEKIHKDQIRKDILHVLIKTNDDRRRHLIFPDHENIFNGTIYFNLHEDQKFSKRIWGKGYMLPGKKYEIDPFGLKEKE